MTAASASLTRPRRWDVIALWGGIAFSLAFTALIAWAGRRLDAIELLPDQGAAWYYWKLPAPSFWTRLSAWGLYLLHQVTAWGLIYYGQTRVRKYTTGLKPVNIVALATTAAFIVLHFIQTHLWYDGLAQDVSIFSSQGSVIVLLVWVLLMENNRRGMFFGKKLPLGQEVVRWARAYHGYFFAWAAIYTFWFHPMVSTPGHLIGFGGIFVITQMHGLGLKLWAKLLVLAVYAGGVAAVYIGRPAADLNEIIRIPVIDYLAVLLLAGLIAAGLRIARAVRRQPRPAMEPSR